MKKIFLSILLINFLGFNINAQYCSVTSATAYSVNMPGITNFSLNTIDRTSASLECGGVNCNSYVNTGESTSLKRGETYTISMTHTRDAVSFPGVTNNIRIWIDYNNNGTLDDAGETVVSLNYEAFGTTTASFTVPSTATLGSTGMRITAKMSDQGGHILPSPCDIPADPIGYHGEMEDYSVNIVLPTGIKENTSNNTVNIYPNPANDILNVDHSFQQSVEFQIVDLYSRQVKTGLLDMTNTSIDISDLTSGQYLLIMQEESGMVNKTFNISR